MKTKEAVAAFEQVREIPYKLPLTVQEVKYNCTGKCQKLKNMLEDLGYDVRYRVCAFSWSDLPLPKNVLSQLDDVNSTHVYLEVNVDGVWVNVDPSWDSNLGNVLTTCNWDGKHSTKIAVPIKEYYDEAESKKIMNGITYDVIQKSIDENKEFFQEFNKWLETIRGKNVIV